MVLSICLSTPSLSSLTALPNAPDAATTSQTEEFNLRQAIIYSEILKPKFEE